MDVAAPPVSLFDPLILPNGAVLKNRIAKAAMEENLGDEQQLPSKAMCRLYETWAMGGAGVNISGNVIVDRNALIGPCGVVLDEHQPLEPFREWARRSTGGGGHMWLQINHPGRQVFVTMGQQAVAPSAIRIEIEGNSHAFPVPRALEPDEIDAIIGRFVMTAKLTEAAGFTGVQIHGAHGYLISQFLSPLSNRRTDAWGGSLENRARLLLDVVKAVRRAVSPGFCVSVKLNSADFQKGGFEEADATQVVHWLNDLPIDLLELSGGTYESPAMQGLPKAGSTIERETYFIDFARRVSAIARMPIMVTGGVRRRSVAQEALEPRNGMPGVAVVGIGTAMIYEPALPRKWQAGEALEVDIPQVTWRNRPAASVGKMALAMLQLRRIGNGQSLKPRANVLLTLIAQRLMIKRRTKKFRARVAVNTPPAVADPTDTQGG
ncbi:2,4-dienoyl-CoA reductase [Mesorhizobium sp. Root554]|uniref:NADH:flavin oxidoreductase/NADH oxidase family protein n=1 Tax=unclassified Mesorhizobium TaxID=325217 RepID=UPI0006F7DBD1|nr:MULTISPECIES: NADH:flavin oxidoreductase/NADH oxidase family protein [unclassified Mesorhizobium]KQZ15355.1 2,4-dienoyl-CoA reductase [Mesorhizobium sp. Root1471]KQZ37863.1 2,4-dienoyl-CoA reductase [Mesorhizobium sp. Root554]